jgi:peptidyl-prolyl cis-trans isomerase C
MKKQMIWTAVAAAVLATLSMSASAQNIAIVNGKAVPKTRVEALMQQVARSGRPITPEVEAQVKEEVIAREIFMQEAQKRGLDATDDYKAQIELARQTILIRELFAEYQKTAAVTDADVQAEYDKFVAANGGKEYRSRHILVETEDQAKAVYASLKKGAKFEDLAKKMSKDPGSGANGGDLDWAAAGFEQRRNNPRLGEEPIWFPHHPFGRRA